MSVGIAGQLSLYDLLDSPSPQPAPPPRPVVQPRPPDLVSDLVSDLDLDLEPAVEADAPSLPPLAVEVTRSPKRKKTAEAHLSESVLHIRIPAACSKADEQYFIEHFSEKFERSRTAALLDLDERARSLARSYDLPLPTSIRWVSNQKHQWGSCTPSEGSIRLSDRMAGFPRWVTDYVIVHELAHLVEGDHGPKFWSLVNRYPKTERARGYLLAKDGV